MRRYQLQIAGQQGRSARLADFECETRADALSIVGRLSLLARAELWQDEFYICTIAQDDPRRVSHGHDNRC